jgi:hypothetical protein
LTDCSFTPQLLPGAASFRSPSINFLLRVFVRATSTILARPFRHLDGIPDQLVEGYVVGREEGEV